MKHPYPIMVNLAGQHCLVVGGGAVAERKVLSLLDAGANVTVISEQFTPGIAVLEQHSGVVLHRQTFHPSMMTGESLYPYALIVAATNDAQVNKSVFELASKQGKLVNVVDQPELSTYIQPSVVRRGKLVIAVSTGGASPSAARKIARDLDRDYGEEYAVYLDFLSEVRQLVQSQISDKQARQRMFKEMLEWDVLARIRDGTFESWKDKLFLAIESEPWPDASSGQAETDRASWSAIQDFGQRV
ncbi:bifunctional precorrin-2 dehydrogenase/sirohydrochlorin ferrochelatase [Paenibacillus sp. GCM10023248]|uniref:precorrin-2 dehydrogenase/sirohydrochlorin ferrochelatase family protein n=1 Tax=Bacillales TaxID=1385 RepID=UPI002379876D|nr:MULTISPECIES: bifunctional precorrin-2 dehydrogenase/sirohydrochlorin ferrochelatase [Bacillales]MDD9269886.1 bifunctional precorrin-2 dehydrogenase/sirohydrochlorin ferrochelatase [Paenibacillus sp. MAHUQ-63]MDR6884927.1 precorrin-2 dehydrogenase/sirohydrochlorin ferrochelatase [Bacillus sp. 3255]